MSECFRIALAGHVIGITSFFAETKDYCKDYLTESEPEFNIEITKEDIIFERQKSAKEMVVEGYSPIDYSDVYLEILAVYRQIAIQLLEHDILLFHGSVIAVDGIGYMFTAKSGTGKSTHAALWRKAFGQRAVMINDDKPLLHISPDKITAYGTPWAGKHRLSTNTSVPLKAICVLTRSEKNHIEPISIQEALPMLCQQSYRPGDSTAMMKTLDLIDQLSHAVRLYRLGCNMEPEAARVAYNGMNQMESPDPQGAKL